MDRSGSVADGQSCLESGVDEARTDRDELLSMPDVERKHVLEVYDAIAPHFSDTRFAIWPGVDRFLTALDEHALVLDLGCGNGKYMHRSQAKNSNGVRIIGCDASEPLAKVAARGCVGDAAVGDAVRAPFRDDAADAAISVAVLHHLSTETRRIHAIRELVRVTRVGGKILIYVWAREQESERATVAKWKRIVAAGHTGSAGFGASMPSPAKNDYLVPWHVPTYSKRGDDRVERATQAGGEFVSENATVRLHRYYHVFTEGELDALVHRHFSSCVRVLSSYFEKSNWAVVLEKTAALVKARAI